MRICYFADGRYIHSHRWLRFFAERGHETHLLSFAPMEARHIAAVEKSGARYHGEIGNFHVKRFWLTARDLRRLRHVLRSERIQILHCHFLGANAWYAALSHFHPLVITVMGGGDVCGPSWHPRTLREWLLTPLALRRADLVTSWSPLMAKVVRPYCREQTQIEVIHGGIDLRKFHPETKSRHLRARWNLPPEGKVIFSPRLMRPLSNIDRIATAAREVCEVYPNAHFLFAAPAEQRDAAYEGKVIEILKQSAAATKSSFIGAVPHEEMADLYRLADVTVSIPSTDGTPMSVLESMACGTPVVVGDIPDYDSHYIEPGKTVLAARTNDSSDLAQAILRLLQEPALAQELTGEARRRVELTGSYEAQMSQMEKLYRGLFA
ncbi:MAG TPA: glycosyltransferase family 4 protein [Pyrinomonadaceae bacterium]|nr:glycosyltransferase family 4 protein [Pyrinomonadaceae bacterium]